MEEVKKEVANEFVEHYKQTLGLEYCEALIEVLIIRSERRLLYGDSFLHETIEDLFSIIDGKRKRFDSLSNNLILADELDEDSQTRIRNKILDEVRDIVNYYLFILTILEKKFEEENG